MTTVWMLRIDLDGTLTEEQSSQLIEQDRVSSVCTTGGTTTVSARLDVDESPFAPIQATIVAADSLRSMGYLNSLINNRAVGIDRITVEGPQARARSLKLLGTAEIAAVLEVSTARVGQLKARPDWPKAAIQVEGGELYWTDDIQRFNENWDRTPGRPRKASTG